MFRGPKWAPNPKNGPTWRDPKMDQKMFSKTRFHLFLPDLNEHFPGIIGSQTNSKQQEKSESPFFSQNVPFWQKSIKFAKKAPKKGKKSVFLRKRAWNVPPLIPNHFGWFLRILTDLEGLFKGKIEFETQKNKKIKFSQKPEKTDIFSESGGNGLKKGTPKFYLILADIVVFEQISGKYLRAIEEIIRKASKLRNMVPKWHFSRNLIIETWPYMAMFF